MLITAPNSLSGTCGQAQFVLGIFKHGMKRVVVLKFSLSCCENMFAGKNTRRKQRKMIHLEFGLVGSELGPLDEFIQVKQQQRLSQKPFSSGSASAVWRSQKVNPHLSLNRSARKCPTKETVV